MKIAIPSTSTGVMLIEKFCVEQNIPVIGRIPFDESVIRWVRWGEPAPLTSGPASEAIHTIASYISQELRIHER